MDKTIKFINKAKKIHGEKYNYNKTNYINSHKKITIICTEHGEFEQTPDSHLSGSGCPKCAGKNKTTEDLINQFNIVHGTNRYNYNKVNFINNKTKIIINCEKHGDFTTLPSNHLSGKGCPICKESRGEKLIREYLINEDINFTQQKKFPDCKYINVLPFDFYLPDLNTCIEFNGEQHYKPIKLFGGEANLIKIQKRDKIKKEYCLKNNIPLIIIKYDDNINKILKNLFK